MTKKKAYFASRTCICILQDINIVIYSDINEIIQVFHRNIAELLLEGTDSSEVFIVEFISFPFLSFSLKTRYRSTTMPPSNTGVLKMLIDVWLTVVVNRKS
jgi:hypothetical protein